MNCKEKISLGEKHTLEDWNKIYLFREGAFLRAYNQNAWLLTNFIYTEEIAKSYGKERGLKIIKATRKFVDEIIMVGFPESSAPKYLQNIPIEEYIPNVFVVEISPSDFDEKYTTQEVFESEYKTFFEKTAIFSSSKQETSKDDVRDGESENDMFTVMRKISQFDEKGKTFAEAIQFIKELKVSINKILFG